MVIPTLIYFIWGYFGFAGAWIPGKYDAEKKKYKVFWGLVNLPSRNATCRIYLYTPFRRQGLIDTTGKVIIPFKYKSVDFARFDGNLISAENVDGKYGLLNKNNKIIQPFIYTSELKNPIYGIFSYFTSEINGKQALIDSLGTQILPAEYSEILMPYHSTIPYLVTSKGLYSAIRFPDGKEIKKDYLITDTSYPDSNDYIKIFGVKSTDLDKNLWSIKTIETPDNPDLDKKYLNLESTENSKYFNDGYTYVSINKSKPIKQWFALYNKKGEELLPLKFDDILWLRYGITWVEKPLIVVKQKGKWGLYNAKQNHWLLPISFQEIKQDVDEKLPLIKVRKNTIGNYSYYDLNGKLILSENIEVHYYDDGREYLIFYKNGNRYKMQYNKEKQKFIWHKL